MQDAGGTPAADFGELEDRYDPAAVEARVFEYWDDVDAYERTVAHREGAEPFFFVDGPPYTSGAAHMGHAWNKSLKDVFIRYQRMRGRDVYDRPGYDMHGLPIETRVEAELDFENKQDIEAYGVDEFIEACREFAQDSLEGLQEDFRSFGVWMDWEDPYRTVEPAYMESAWWAFKRVHERGLVDRGLRSITQCPRCQTAIAKNEVEYHEVEDPSIYVTFPLVDREGSLVIWTTTPWTLPANAFVAVDEELEYVAVRAEREDADDVLYVAEGLVEEVLKKGRYRDYEVLETFTGAEMVGWRYEHPLAEQVPAHVDGEGTLQVHHADYVEADRTGLVHSAPGHGEEDFNRGTQLGLEPFCPVGEDGVFDDEAGAYAGQFVRDANRDIIDDLEANGHLLASETYVHDYGQCWRCDTGIVQIVTDQWFITVTDVKTELLENIEDTQWYPSWARDNRFRDFVEDAPDWNVSRQRYWGIPIPIWLPPDWEGDMADAIVIGTRKELAERVDQDLDPEGVDLHKPTVDALTITEDGVTHERVPDVFDVWLDSSVATWGTLGYPGEPGSEAAFEELWPADLIIEAHDQTRGWFWSQLGMGTAALDRAPYRRVVMHGHALMPDGRAMSKSRDITIAPEEVIEAHGADPMRLFLLSIAARGDDMRVSWEELAEMERRLNILWNAVRFPLPYMELDDVTPAELSVAETRLEAIDRWLLARLQTVVGEATAAMDDYAQHEAAETLLDFVIEDVSRYYIQVVRERMWEEAATAGKRGAYATLARVLEETVVLLAPFVPFVAEELYQRLTRDAGHPTVHMADWPRVDEGLRDEALEAAIDVVRDVEEAGSHARQRAGRKLRWPVARVVVDAEADDVVAALETHTDLLADRLNARSVRIVPPDEDWDDLEYSAEADLSVLGPAFGDRADEVVAAMNEARLDAPTLDALREDLGEVLGERVELTDEMVTFVEVPPEAVEAAEFAGGTVYVDAELTDDLEAEGYAREVIRRVQEMRKELDLDVERQIRLEMVIDDARVAELVADHEAFVAEEVRAAELGPVDDGHEREWEVEGVTMKFTVEPLAETVV